MEKRTPIEPVSEAKAPKYDLRIQSAEDPLESRRLPLWYLWPALAPIFIWIVAPHYGPVWFALAATALFLGLWAMLRLERKADSANVDRELTLYLLTAVFAGFALACWGFLLVLA